MKDPFSGFDIACCNCAETPTEENLKVCSDCGGYCCSQDCLENHECDEDGDLEDED